MKDFDLPPAIHAQPISHASAWYGRDLSRDLSWIVPLEQAHIDEIAHAVRGVRQRGLQLTSVTKSDFPLPTTQHLLACQLEELREGRGFVVLRGLPAQDYSDEEVGLIFWGIGLYLGQAVAQNPRGDLLGHVFDQGRRYGALDVRGYETNAHLPFHTDSGDLVGLLCLRAAASGGLSSVVSSVTLHNEILRRRPEFLTPLYRGYHYIRREAALTGEAVTPQRVPVFGACDGIISARLVRNQINAACAKTGTPLTALEKDALDLLDTLAQDPDIHLDMNLQVGDMQFCNNYTIMHSRTGFSDYPEPERRRHMIRLWLTMADRRKLPPCFPPHNGYVRNQSIETALKTAG